MFRLITVTFLAAFVLVGMTAAQDRKTFTVGTATAARGQKATGTIEVPAGSDAALSIPVAVVHGAKPGPVLALVEGFVPSGERDTSEVIDAGQRASVVPHLWLAFHLENFVPNEQSELFEVIAASRGVRVKFFSDTEHALMWLRSNAPA